MLMLKFFQPEHFCLMSYSWMNDERLMGIQELKDKIVIEYMAKNNFHGYQHKTEQSELRNLSYVYKVILP